MTRQNTLLKRSRRRLLEELKGHWSQAHKAVWMCRATCPRSTSLGLTLCGMRPQASGVHQWLWLAEEQMLDCAILFKTRRTQKCQVQGFTQWLVSHFCFPPAIFITQWQVPQNDNWTPLQKGHWLVVHGWTQIKRVNPWRWKMKEQPPLLNPKYQGFPSLHRKDSSYFHWSFIVYLREIQSTHVA